MALGPTSDSSAASLSSKPLIAIECAVQILLLARDDVAELADRLLEVRELLFDGVEARGHS